MWRDHSGMTKHKFDPNNQPNCPLFSSARRICPLFKSLFEYHTYFSNIQPYPFLEVIYLEFINLRSKFIYSPSLIAGMQWHQIYICGWEWIHQEPIGKLVLVLLTIWKCWWSRGCNHRDLQKKLQCCQDKTFGMSSLLYFWLL